MASRPVPAGAAPKRLLTYKKGPRDRLGDNAPSLPASNGGSSSVYDFPDSDDSTSASASRSKPASPFPGRGIKSRDSRGLNDSKDHLRNPPNTKRRVDDGRKRKHAKAFDTDAIMKRPSEPAVERVPSRTPKRLPADQYTRQPVSTNRPVASRSMTEVPLRKKPDARRTLGAAQRDIPPPSEKTTQKSLSVPASPKTPYKSDSRSRRPRLIDRLAAQKTEASESSADSGSNASLESGNSDVEDSDMQLVADSKTSSQTPLPNRSVREGDVWARPAPGQPGLASSKKVRHTYSQARSIRGETQSQEDPFGLAGDLQNESLASSPTSKPGANAFAFPADDFDLDDDDEDDEPRTTIKSVHELRRAGANNRFADEMEDLLSRIGIPNKQNMSMRRGALLELAQKLQNDGFACQFRDHAARDKVAKSIRIEEDIISGFAIAASLIEFLTSHQAPHLIRQLVEEEVGKLINRLLGNSEDIVVIAGQRSTNMSKMGRNALGNIKSALTRLPIWHGCEVNELSPRTTGLHLLHILLCNLESRHRAAILGDAKGQFSHLVKDCAGDGGDIDANSALVLLIMECESEADTISPNVEQSRERALASAHFFQRTLARWPNQRGELESASLKLAINTTNAERGAQAFSSEALLRSLVVCISEGLIQVQKAVDSSALETNMYDGLLLMLGVLINILEHCEAARTSLDHFSLEKLANLYLDNRKSVGDADSEDRSKVSVAVGYLAVALGYLCLEPRGRALMRERSHDAGVGDLIGTIREFIGLYRAVDAKMHELEGLVNDLRRLDRQR